MCSERVHSRGEFLPLANFMISGKLLSSSAPQLPYRSNARGQIPYAVDLW